MMHSHILIILRIEIVKIVLILVVMDDALAHYCDAGSDDYLYVLILVVMDDALALRSSCQILNTSLTS